MVEIQINVPYGHVAAKWWGRRDVRPIVCIHGWQDNAASFDTLIPLLPDHVGYLAIDLPGHGLSSRIPNGLMYSTIIEIYVLNFIIKQFGWSKVSLMGHSMGALTSFIYAATYPERVDIIIELDALQPRVFTPANILRLNRFVDVAYQSDIRNTNGEEPPTYTYDELIGKMNSQLFVLSKSSSIRLLARAAKESSKNKGRYYFTRDHRVKSFHMSLYTPETNLKFAERINCPLLFVKAKDSLFHESIELQKPIIEELKKKPHFEMVIVEGEHHVHLNEPEKISRIVSEFLLKHKHFYGEYLVMSSKL